MRVLSGRRSIVIAGLVAAAAAVAGVAYATIPDDAGVINGGNKKKAGPLRVVNRGGGKKCTSFEPRIRGSRRGRKGDPGPRGPAGPAGPPGPAGSFGTL